MGYYTRAELEKAILNMEFDDEYTSFYDEIKVSRWDKDKEKSIEIPGIGDAQFVDSTGGYEDEGSYMDVVFKINSDGRDRFFRKTGTYDSWDSSEWDGAFEEVKEKTSTKIIWVNIKD